MFNLATWKNLKIDTNDNLVSCQDNRKGKRGSYHKCVPSPMWMELALSQLFANVCLHSSPQAAEWVCRELDMLHQGFSTDLIRFLCFSLRLSSSVVYELSLCLTKEKGPTFLRICFWKQCFNLPGVILIGFLQIAHYKGLCSPVTWR